MAMHRARTRREGRNRTKILIFPASNPSAAAIFGIAFTTGVYRGAYKAKAVRPAGCGDAARQLRGGRGNCAAINAVGVCEKLFEHAIISLQLTASFENRLVLLQTASHDAGRRILRDSQRFFFILCNDARHAT